MTGPTRFLLVEDNDDHALLVVAAFGPADQSSVLERVKDGERALLRLRGEPPLTDGPPIDVVLLDINLPGQDGFEVLKAIRADAALQTLPVIVLSTSSAERDVARASAAGATSYVAKPVGLDEWERVLGMLRNAWSTSRGRGMAGETAEQTLAATGAMNS
jgi:chemotaxis family two-component system response regulator Rcp1